jgi:hypothetical protein
MKMCAHVSAFVVLVAFITCGTPSQSQPPPSLGHSGRLSSWCRADITARLMADQLTKRWNQPVVVENRPGADGIVALTAFLASPDDHILLFGDQ